MGMELTGWRWKNNPEGSWQPGPAVGLRLMLVGRGESITATEPLPGHGYLLSHVNFHFAIPPVVGFPPLFLGVQGNQIVDVTNQPHLRSILEERLQYYLDRLEDSPSHPGFLAIYAAIQARLGRIEEAWPRVLRNYDRDMDYYEDFPSRLAARLRAFGYIPEDLVLPTSLEPEP